MILNRFGRLVGAALAAMLALGPVATSAQSVLQQPNLDRTKGPVDDLPSAVAKLYENEQLLQRLLGATGSSFGTAAFLNLGTAPGTVADGGTLASEILRAQSAEAAKLDKMGDASGASVTSNGYTRSLGSALQLGGGATSVPVTGGTVTLTPAQLASGNIVLTGALTSGLSLQFPAGISGTWSVTNATSGAFSASARVSSQPASAIPLPQGYPRTVVSDGATLNSALFSTVTTPSSTVTGNLAVWAGTNGQALNDAGVGIGTIGSAIPVLSGANTWSGVQTHTAKDIYGGSTSPGIRLMPTGGHNWTIGANASIAGVGFYDEIGAWRMYARDADGYVGINTTSPGALLDVAGTMRGQFLALSAAPTSTNIPASYWTVVKRTDDGSLKLCGNDGGTIKCAIMQ